MKRLAILVALAIALVLVALAAFTYASRSSKATSPPYPAQPVAQTPASAVDAALRKAIDGYVGLSTNPEGNVVRLTLSDSNGSGAATKLAGEVWTRVVRKNGGDLPRFAIVEAAAGPEDLNAAFANMRDVLTLPDTVFLDLDEACGCITVGIATAAAAAQVASFATAHGVSQGVVKTVMTPPIRRVLNLQDEFRPTMGGVQIQFDVNSTTIGNCSLGLPVWSFNRGTYGFLTASHCTAGPQGVLLLTPFAQRGGRTVNGGDKIGMETLDLALFNTTANSRCPMGRLCRFSDTAFADYDEDTLGITGRITRPNSTVCTAVGTSCALSVGRSTDDIRVVGAISGLVTGDLVDKVGRTSGWTRGAITNTCLDTNVVNVDAQGNTVDTMITMLCQYRVATTSLGGDSGGPVFQFSPKTGNGLFAGILWGGSATPATAFMVFSPVDRIREELGSFVYNQYGVASPFRTNGRFRTSDVADELEVTVRDNAVPSGEVEFVLNAGPVTHRATKQIVLAEGPTIGTGRWTLEVTNPGDTARNGLYLYQLPGGLLLFRKQIGNTIKEVSRVPIDLVPGGTRVTFNWLED
jgi:hypothetical protein